MKTIKTLLTTEAVFSNDQKKRYLLKKSWDDKKPHLAIIMLTPSEASGISLDTTTQLVLNNSDRLGFGSVSIINLFCTLNDFSLSQAEEADKENLKIIQEVAETADTIVYAAGVGKAKNKAFQKRQADVLTLLKPFKKKLRCLCNQNGEARLQHPLSPAVRTWYLSPMTIDELIPAKTEEK